MNNLYKSHGFRNFSIRWTRWTSHDGVHVKHKVLIVRSRVYEGFMRNDKRKLKRTLRHLGYIN
jgi:hypothetical protein